MGKYRKKVGGQSYQNYDGKILEKAVNEIRLLKKPIGQVAEKYGLPKSTVYDYLQKHGQPILKPGGQPVLARIDEDYLTSGLIKCAE